MDRPIAVVIREGRLAKGLKQTEVAEAAGFSASYLNQIENGITRPSADKLWKLVEVLDLELTKAEVLKGYLEAKTAKDFGLTHEEGNLVRAFRRKDISACLKVIEENLM